MLLIRNLLPNSNEFTYYLHLYIKLSTKYFKLEVFFFYFDTNDVCKLVLDR